jgi:hypothetical protein
LNDLTIRLRFDYAGTSKSGKLFGGKNVEQLAEENRQHKVSLIRNVPIQGIRIEDIDMSQDIYLVLDDFSGKKVAYAPVVITFTADGLEDVIKFAMKEEFRTVEVLEPASLELSRYEIERMLIKVSDELSDYKEYLLRKVNNWK